MNVDNRWVVPYNPYLSSKYNAHINVEVCSTVMAVKYLYKYVYKGRDRIMAAVCEDDQQQTDDVNEINRFVDARYVSACEGCWHLFHYDLHERSPSIQRLDIHLPNQNRIVYVPGQAAEALDQAKETTLTAWFICNRDYPEARFVPYHKFPEQFTWNSTTCKWSPRKRGNTIGHLYSASPSEGE